MALPNTTSRHLPARHNPLMTEEVPAYMDLVARRRLGQTQLTPKMVGAVDGDVPSLGVFDYAHLRAPLPKGIVSGIFKSSPNSYFLMRRSNDGFVSATGMFKATFPYAEASEEEKERIYIKSLPTTSPEETAGNVWISPEQALILAEEYHISPWIRALLDPTSIPVTTTSPDSPPKSITAPPKFDLFKVQPQLAPPTPTSLPRSSRSRRSASPSKSLAASTSTARPIKSPRKRTSKSKSDSVDSTPSLSSKAEINGVITEDQEGEAVAETVMKTVEFEPAIVLEPREEEPKVKIHVDQDVTVDADGVETKRTAVSLEVPITSGEPPSAEEVKAMLAQAAEVTEAASEAVAASDAPKKSKRKAEDISAGDDDADAAESALVEAPRAKKAKTEAEEKRTRVRRRAFIGLTASVAIGALVPYFLGIL